MAPLINQDIDSLIGGVSQQPAEIRKESQVSALDNATLDPAVGLAKRPATEAVASVSAPTAAHKVFWHPYDAGPGHRYLIRVKAELDPLGTSEIEAINVETGVSQNVATPNATPHQYEYFAGAGRVSFVTVGTRVYASNDVVEVALAPTGEAVPEPQVLMQVLEPPVSIDRTDFVPLEITSTDSSGDPVSTVSVRLDNHTGTNQTSIDDMSSESATSNMTKHLFTMLTHSTFADEHSSPTIFKLGNEYRFVGSNTGDYTTMMGVYNPISSTTSFQGDLLGFSVLVSALNLFLLPGSRDTTEFVNVTDPLNTWSGWTWRLLNSSTLDSIDIAKIAASGTGGSDVSKFVGSSTIIHGTYNAANDYPSVYNIHEESWAVSSGTDNNILIFTNEAGPLLEQLPYIAPDGFNTRITTDSESETDHYYLEFNKEDGAWVERWKPGEDREIDKSTMPHALEYDRAAGTFTLDEVVWDLRKCGDIATHTAPSFVGGNINDMAFYKDRLVIASGQNVVFSETREPGNWWRTTMTQLLDSDRLDLAVSAGNQGAGTITSLTPGPQGLLVSTDQAQFLVTSRDNAFTGANVTIDNLSRQVTSLYTTPIVSQDRAYFTSEVGSTSRLWEFVISGDTGTAIDVTGHCPTYLEGVVGSLSTSDLDNTVFAVANGVVYVYRYLQNQQQRLQAAWGRWLIEGDVTFVTTMGDSTYLATDSSVIELLKPSDHDPCDWQVHLDWRHAATNATALTGADEGFFTCDPPTAFITSTSWTLSDINTGETFTNLGSVAVPRFKGDPTNRNLIWGIPYEMSVELSPFVLKKTSGLSNRVTPYVGGRSQLKTFRLNYHNSGPFTIYTDIGGEVEATTHEHSNLFVGGPLEVPPPADGQFLTDVGGNATETNIKIRSDSQLPVELSSANMEVVYYRRGSSRTS